MGKGKATKHRFVKTFGGDVHEKLYGVRTAKVQTALDGIDAKVDAFRVDRGFTPGLDTATTVTGLKTEFARISAAANDRQKYTELKTLKDRVRRIEVDIENYAKYFGQFHDKLLDQKEMPPASELPRITNRELKQLFRTAGEYGFDLKTVDAVEAVAVFQYTGNIHKDINNHMLGLADPPIVGQALSELEAVRDLTISAMAKLPSKPATSMRGETRWPGDTAQYAMDNVFEIAAFWSTGIGYSFGGEWQLTVNGKTGKDVQALSSNPTENELLFPPRTRFKVMAVRDGPVAGSTFAVTLQEV